LRKPKQPVGVVVWEGPSLIDKKPIVVIANGFKNVSQNRKTGPMVQVYILRSDVPAWTAITTGDDRSICGDCKFRAKKDSGGSGRTCYVQVWPYVETIYKAYLRGTYTPVCDLQENPFKDKNIRIGTYGDPAAVPLYVWQHMIREAKAWTAYTHGWKTCDLGLQSIAMASVDSREELEEARAMGWRTFRTRFRTESLQAGEIVCPASKEAGVKSSCIDCRLCDGNSSVRIGKDDKRTSIAIIAHGNGASHFVVARSTERQLRLHILNEAVPA
jgi:hypothetical protein